MANLNMMRSISLFLLIISSFVLLSTLTYFQDIKLFKLYVLIFILELSIFMMCLLLAKREVSFIWGNILTALYLFHMLAAGGYIGIVFSVAESVPVFIAVLVISSMLFTMPPIYSATIAILSTVATLIASYYFKSEYWFKSDFINCVGVLILSLLLGYKVNRTRVEEAFARFRVLELNLQLKQASNTDRLTGLPNHRSFQDDYYQMFRQAQMHVHRIGVIMMDLDKFKAYNDNYWHVKGDQCLMIVAGAFLENVKEGVSVYRYGGEEFIVLLSDHQCGNATQIANDIRASVERQSIEHAYSGVADIITISMGLFVGIPAILDKPMSFIDHADKAMYHSKQSGRNRLTPDIQ